MGQNDDGPKPPTTAEGAHHAHNSIPNTSDTPAHLGETTPRIDGGMLPQTVPAVQVLHQVKPGLSLALARYVKVIAPHLDRGPRHPNSQHCSTEVVRLQGHAEPADVLGQRLKRAGGGTHPGLESVPPKTSPRKSSHLSDPLPTHLETVNGCDKLGEMLAHACVEAIDDEDALGLSAVETAAKLIVVCSDMERPSLATSPTRFLANPASVRPSTRD